MHDLLYKLRSSLPGIYIPEPESLNRAYVTMFRIHLCKRLSLDVILVTLAENEIGRRFALMKDNARRDHDNPNSIKVRMGKEEFFQVGLYEQSGHLEKAIERRLFGDNVHQDGPRSKPWKKNLPEDLPRLHQCNLQERYVLEVLRLCMAHNQKRVCHTITHYIYSFTGLDPNLILELLNLEPEEPESEEPEPEEPENKRKKPVHHNFKSKIGRSLNERFGLLFEECPPPEYFKRTQANVETTALMENSLKSFNYWNHQCITLSKDGEWVMPDQQGNGKLNRQLPEKSIMKALICPRCLKKVVTLIPRLEKKMKISPPMFKLLPPPSSDPSGPDPSNPPQVTQAEWAELIREVALESLLRRFRMPMELKVLADGVEIRNWDLRFNSTITFTVEDETEYVEVRAHVGKRDLLLACWRMSEIQEMAEQGLVEFSFSLEGWQTVAFKVIFNGADEGSSATVDASYQESRPDRRSLLWVYRRLTRFQDLRPQFNRPEWRWPGFALAVLGLALLLIAMWWSRPHDRRKANDERVYKPPANSPSPTGIPSGNDQRHLVPGMNEKNEVAQHAKLRDNNQEIQYSRQGIQTSLSLSQPELELLSDSVKLGQLAPMRNPQQLRSLRSGDGGVYLGGRDDEKQFRLIEPVGKVIGTTRPRLSWEGFNEAHEYLVQIFEVVPGNLSQVLSERLPADHRTWQLPAKRLKPGKTYTWQVIALAPDGGELATSPSTLEPEARFSIPDQQSLNRLRQATRDYPEFHLLLANLYSQVGLYDQAERELKILARANPGNELPVRMLNSLRELRHRTAIETR